VAPDAQPDVAFISSALPDPLRHASTGIDEPEEACSNHRIQASRGVNEHVVLRKRIETAWGVIHP
jgi:hypothetical protein